MPAAISARPRAFLFDLDGVLVRTEEIHHEAYRRMCAARGHRLEWDFERYCLAAHYGSERLAAELARALPGLFAEEPRWEVLYAEKSRIYLDLVTTAPVELQPGAEATLRRLADADRPRAVVTNSTRAQTAVLRERLPILASVPLWVPREDYAEAKPAPDAYRFALGRLAVDAADAVGFEDTPRGLQALAAAGVAAVLVTRIPYPDLGGVVPALHVPDLAGLPGSLLDQA